jgi:aspartate racemase
MGRKIIGIAGGVGPYAGLDLNRKIFDNTLTDGTDQDHLEVVLHSSGPLVADRTAWLLDGSSSGNPAEGLFESLRALAAAGATVAAIACNTAHTERILDPLKDMLYKSGLEIELVDMIEQTGIFIDKEFSGTGGGDEDAPVRIGLLSTAGTLATGVYDRLESGRFGVVELLRPDPDVADAVHRAIYDQHWGIKAQSNPVSARATKDCVDAVRHLAERGAGAVVLGCTELPLAVPGKEMCGIALIDPGEIVARTLISRVAAEKLTPGPE